VSESATPFGIAIDGSGNLWFTYYADNEIVELVGVATPVVTPLAVAVQSATLGAQP
jgi:streptogramin lyase